MPNRQSFGAGNDHTVKVWSDKILKQALKKSMFAKFVKTKLPSCPICNIETECNEHTIHDLINYIRSTIAMLNEENITMREEVSYLEASLNKTADELIEANHLIGASMADIDILKGEIKRLEEAHEN